MTKKSDLELSDDLIAEVGNGPTAADLPSDEEIEDLFDLAEEYCPECDALLDEDGECPDCTPDYEPFEDEPADDYTA